MVGRVWANRNIFKSGFKCKKKIRTKTIRGKTFINRWITKVKLFWKKSGAGVL